MLSPVASSFFQDNSQERESAVLRASSFTLFAPSVIACLRFSTSALICAIIAWFSAESPKPTASLNLYHPSLILSSPSIKPLVSTFQRNLNVSTNRSQTFFMNCTITSHCFPQPCTLVQQATMAAIRPTTRATIHTSGQAYREAFKAHCTVVHPPVATIPSHTAFAFVAIAARLVHISYAIRATVKAPRAAVNPHTNGLPS